MRLPTFPVLIALLACSCGSSGVEGNEFGGPPAGPRGFPSQAWVGIVFAQATYQDHARAMDLDLVGEAGVLPIHLEVVLRGKQQEEAQLILSPDRMNMRLYLPDGSVLRALSVDEVVGRLSRKRQEPRVREAAFRPSLLNTTGIKGYVFFALEPAGELQVEGRSVRHLARGVVRSMDVADSLVAFEYTDGSAGGAPVPMYVGIQR